MTLPLPRRPRTTARGPIIPVRTPASLAAAVALLLGGIALAGPTDYAPSRVGTPPTVEALPIVPLTIPVNAHWAAPAAPAQPIRLLAYQARQPVPPTAPSPADEGKNEYQIDINPPGVQRLSQLDSDRKLQERIRQETIERTGKDQVVFPDEPVLSNEKYRSRRGQWSTRQMTVEPYFVNYKPVYFQQLNTERYGWDLGPLTPLACLGKFYYDVASFPIALGAYGCCQRDASTGYCLPGDPVPLLLYPPNLTVTGVTLETAAIMALIAIFP